MRRRGRKVHVGHGLAVDVRAARGDPGASPLLLDASPYKPLEHAQRAGVLLRQVLGHAGTVGRTTDIIAQTTPTCRASG